MYLFTIAVDRVEIRDEFRDYKYITRELVAMKFDILQYTTHCNGLKYVAHHSHVQ